jgi:hypothetical protein
MNDPALSSLTGIPIEILFGVIGALGGAVWYDLRRSVRKLTHESEKRGRLLVQICDKLGINWHDQL